MYMFEFMFYRFGFASGGKGDAQRIRAWNLPGNKDSCGNENGKSRENVLSVGKKINKHTFFFL